MMISLHKYICILFFTSFYLACPAQEKTLKYFDKDWKSCEKERAVYYREIYYQFARKPTSIVRDYYMNGRLQWEGKLISENPDVLDSACNWYDGNGSRTEQRTYKSGQLNGPWTTYYEDGSIHEKNQYVNGLQHGLSVSYWPGGKTHVKAYYKKGRLDGERSVFYENGKLAQYAHFYRDTIRGASITYDSTGKDMIEHITYKSGLIDGLWLKYHKNGHLAEKRIFHKGLEKGPDTAWYENGVISRVSTYEDHGKIYHHMNFREDGSAAGINTNKEYPDTISLHIAKDNINCLYGLKNYKAEWVVQPVYTFISESESETGYFSTTRNEKYGIISSDGRFALAPDYDEVMLMKNSFGNRALDKAQFFRYKKGEFYGLISRQSGKIILNAEYSWIDNAPGAFFIVHKNDLSGLADSMGIILEPDYHVLEHVFGGPYFSFRQNVTVQFEGRDSVVVKKGMINIKGDTIVLPAYDDFYIRTVNGKSFIWTINRTLNDNRLFGLYGIDGKELLPAAYHFTGYDFPDFSGHGVDVLIKDQSYYLQDTSGRIMTETPYEFLSALKYNNHYQTKGKAAAIFRSNNTYGLLNANGGIIMAPRYEVMQEFYHPTLKIMDTQHFLHHFIVKLNGRYGIVDENDSVILPFAYELIYAVKERLFTISNHYLKTLSMTDYKEILNNLHFENRMARFCTEDANLQNECYCCGIVNDTGRVLLDPFYVVKDYNKRKSTFSNRAGMQGYILDNGQIEYSIKKDYKEIGEFKDGVAWVASYNGKMGIVDEDENLVVDTLYDAVSDLDPVNGTFWVKPTMRKDSFNTEGHIYDEFPRYGGWGLVNRYHQLLLDTIYNFPSHFRNGYGIVKDIGFQYGLVRSDGLIVLPCIYQDLRRQENGLYLLKDNGKWGLADSLGRIIVQPLWTEVTSFLGNYALFQIDSSDIGLVDANGKMTYHVEKAYNLSGRCLADSLVFFGAVWNELEDKASDELKSQIEGYELTDSIPDIKNRNMLRNRLIILACEDFFLDEKIEDYPEDPDIYFDIEKYSPGNYWEYGIALEGLNYRVQIASVNMRSFTLDQVLENYYAPPKGIGYSHYTHNFYSYGFKKDSVHRLALKDLLVPAYHTVLNKAIVNGMKEIDDPDIDCTDPDKYLENLENSFAITPNGIVFYLNPELAESDDESLELLIPYSAIRTIINKKSVLSEFVK